MLDIAIYIGIIITLFFVFIGVYTKRSLGYFLGSAFSVLIAIGLFTTGWQTYSVPTFVITESGSTTTVTPQIFTIVASATGTMEERTIFFIASLTVILTIIFVFAGLKERQRNAAAQSREE